MATFANTLEHRLAGASGQRAVRRSRAGRERLDRVVRWLRADVRDATELRPRAGANAPDARGTDAPAGAQLDAGLRRWRAALRRHRAIVVVRRQLIVTAALAVVLQALHASGLFGQAVVPAVALALLLAGIAVVLSRGQSLEDVAHVLDERLGLFDQLATALDIGRRPDAGSRPLERRALATSATLMSASLSGWRAAGRRGAREWGALAAALAVLALLVLFAQPAGSNPGSAARPGTAGAAGTTAGGGSHRAGAHTGTHATSKTEARAPSLSHLRSNVNAGRFPSADPYGGASAGYHSPSGQSLTYSQSAQPKSSVNVPRAPGERSADVGVPPSTASHSSPGTSAGSSGKNFAGIGAASTQGAISPVTAPTQQPATTVQRATRANAAEPGTSSPSTSKSAAGQSSAASRSNAAGGTPSASPTAGHQRGSSTLGGADTAHGQATHNLQLQAGYAPIHSGKITRSGKPGSGEGGGGGPGRSSLVEGETSSSGEGSFPYVPSEGGSVSGGDAVLLTNYLQSLSWLKGQSW